MAQSFGHEYVVLDLYKGINKQLEFMQRDALTRIIEVSLTFNGKRFSVEDCDVEFHVTRPSGLISFVTMDVVDAPNGVVKATFTNQMLLEVGKLKCEVVVRNNAIQSKISFPVFYPIVKQSTFADGTIQGSDEFTRLEDLMKDINDFKNDIGNPNDLNTNDKTIIGGINEVHNKLELHLALPHITYREIVPYHAVITTHDEIAIVTNDGKGIEKTGNVTKTTKATTKAVPTDSIKITQLANKKPTNDDLLVIETAHGTASTKVSDLPFSIKYIRV